MSPTIHEKALIIELLECENLIDDEQFSDDDRKVLAQLREKGMVALSWRTLPKGIRWTGEG